VAEPPPIDNVGPAVELVGAVLWQRGDGGAERCRLERMGRGWRLNGVALVADRHQPIEARYIVTSDQGWRAEAAHLVIIEPARTIRLHLTRDAQGWHLDGELRPDLGDCVDVDLALSAATHTLAIRRLRLGIGDSAETVAALIRFPELEVVRTVQRYRRDSTDVYARVSGGLESQLQVDAEGLVIGDGRWTAIARTTSP
jgi:uncharacterized protein